ncbi:hypothetical protein ACFX1Q_021956 [Malus domestica]
MTGSVARANTTASSGQPELRSTVAIFEPKLEALMESAAAAAAAFASPEAANQASDTDAQIKTQKANLTGRSSNNGKSSSSSSVSGNPREETPVAARARGEIAKKGFDLGKV